MCIVHDCIVFDSSNDDVIYDSFYKYRNSGSGIIKNIWKNTYIGCCMTIDARMKNTILPIPNDIEMHDQWIGLLCEKEGKSLFINDKLINYRRHNDNVTNMKHYSVWRMIKNRVRIMIKLIRR